MIPQDVDMSEKDSFGIYPRANLFLISDEVRRGPVGLYTAVNGKKPFLNSWDSAKDWDVRMRKKEDSLSLAAISLGEPNLETRLPAPACDHQEQALQKPYADGATTSRSTNPITVDLSDCRLPLEGIESAQTESRREEDRLVQTTLRKSAEDQQNQGGKEAVLYNLRSRPAPYDVLRKPGLHGLGHAPIKTPKGKRSVLAPSKLGIPPLAMSFVGSSTTLAQPSGQHLETLGEDQQERDVDEVVPMDEDVLATVVPSESELDLKTAISNGCRVIGGADGQMFIVRRTSITTEIASQYVSRYQQILQERATLSSSR